MMLPSPPTTWIAGIEAVVVGLSLLGFGYLVVQSLTARARLDRFDRVGLAFPALCGYMLVLTLVHMATRGEVLSSPWIVRSLTGVVALMLIGIRLTRRSGTKPDPASRMESYALAAVIVAGLVAWGIPTFLMLPIDPIGDMSQHMGWAEQYLTGTPTPTSGVLGEVPNSYTWLYHAFVAFVSHFTPGGRAFHAQGPVQVAQVTGVVVTLFALGRRLTDSWVGATAASFFGALSGGFGYLLARGPELVLKPREIKALLYLGDLLYRRSYNYAFHNIAAPYPRDMNVALLPAYLLLVSVGLSQKSYVALVASGVTLGMIGLSQPDGFFVGSLFGLLVIFFSRRTVSPLKAAAALFAPAVLLWSLWIVPLTINYFRLGGFQDASVGLVEMPVYAMLFSWGISTAFAIYGAVRWLPKARGSIGARVVIGMMTAAALCIVATRVIPAVLGSGFTTLGFAHRYWPYFSLGVALLGACGLSTAVLRLESGRLQAVAILAAVAVVAMPSPVLASLALPKTLGKAGVGRQLLRSSLTGHDGTLLNAMIRPPGYQCRVSTPPLISFRTFSYTGYQHVMFTRLPPYNAFLRYKDAFGRLISMSERIADARTLSHPANAPHEWKRLVDKYDLDLVVVPAWQGQAPAIADYERARVDGADLGDFVVVTTGSCRN